MSFYEMEAREFRLPTPSEVDTLPPDELCGMDWAQRRVFVEVHANINFYLCVQPGPLRSSFSFPRSLSLKPRRVSRPRVCVPLPSPERPRCVT